MDVEIAHGDAEVMVRIAFAYRPGPTALCLGDAELTGWRRLDGGPRSEGLASTIEAWWARHGHDMACDRAGGWA